MAEQFLHRGRRVSISAHGDEAEIVIDGRRFPAMRHHRMWSAPGVFNHYQSLGALARYIASYLDVIGQQDNPGEPLH